MRIDERLVDRIYEASVISEDWPDLLQHIADTVGARGAVIMTRSPEQTGLISSPLIAADVEEYIAAGWAADPAHTMPLFAEQWPGFRAEIDYRTAEEISKLPVHAEYLDPRGYYAGTGTVVQGCKDDVVHLAFEGFSSHRAAREAVPALDSLRPHLARAISLTALRRDRSILVTDSLAAAGVPAAVIGPDGRLRAANLPFVAKMGSRMLEIGPRVRFTDGFLMNQLALALEHQRAHRGRVQSIAVRSDDRSASFAMHILPLIGAAREASGGDGLLLLIGNPSNVSTPSSDVLKLLFDLTPAEARIARHMAQGAGVRKIAVTLMVNEQTVRTHLKAIFVKMGVHRQAELVRLLGRFGPPNSQA